MKLTQTLMILFGKKRKKDLPQLEERVSFIEKNITYLALFTVILGAVVAFTLPVVFARYGFYGLVQPNEIGDAFNGIASPVLSIIGILLTFLAFYVQYMANERQVRELEKQKRFAEYHEIEDQIRDLKQDIQSLSYTKNNVTYHFSEAIWNYMIDNVKEEACEETIFNPMFFQMAYALRLFEPMINEIDKSQIESKEKRLAFSNVNGLFESSLDLILRISDEAVKKHKIKLKSALRSKIVVPAKRIKLMLREKIELYTESEKEQFTKAVAEMRGAGFIKQAKMLYGKGTIIFFNNYENYLKSLAEKGILVEKLEKEKSKEKDAKQPEKELFASLQSYQSFISESNVLKFFVSEPIKIMMNLETLERIEINLPTETKNYSCAISRNDLEDFLGLDLAELKIDRDLWRDEFLGKVVHNKKTNEEYLKKFVKIKQLNIENNKV